ncbi:hypothetical protein J0383_16185 [Flavobacterium endoglycinae]|uniref:Uncharacterized protein n=1 Tax=Flavobacterium endoglycinae TaxID=2816357 RepID=A0ABX7QAQ9_9FLAO|nr:hypothetical protein [Flavobacterium endoglycinae]QSW87805.1 hypothetical protein J0383_16185 [Flavobacterium endoglycinae]
MSSELKVKIKRSFLDYKRNLHLHPDFIKFEDKDLANDDSTFFKVNEIKEFRYGITFYQYKFVFGREYQLFIKNSNNKILKINFNTYLGIKKHECHELYSNILNSLWDLYFKDKTLSFIEKFQSGESFLIGDVNITQEGVIIEVSKLFKQEKKLILWHDIAVRKYNTYISIYSKENSLDFNRGYSYKNDWNTFVLYNVINNIIENKNTN